MSTPPTSTHSQDDGPTNRKGRATRTTKRKNKPAADKPNVPLLDKPLSELTKDLSVPVRDMEAWVNRSVEAREAETAKRKGQIARPMNSFMLYRSAYAERTKMWCTHNNHQIVSAVSGKSWPMEPPIVRDWYHELARKERDNHQKAFPGYKFSPSKTNSSGQRKRKDGDDKEEAILTDRESNSEYSPSGGSRRRPRPVHRSATPEFGYGYHQEYTSMPGPLPYPMQHDPREPMNASHFSASNPGQMMPEPLQHAYDQRYFEHQYPETQLAPGGPPDALWLQHQHAMQAAQHSVVGLPGGAHSDMLDESWTGTPMAEHGQIDPTLMSDYEQSLFSQDQMQHAGAFNERSFQDFEGDMAHAQYGPPTGGSGHGGMVSFSPMVKSTEDEQEEFERIMNGEAH